MSELKPKKEIVDRILRKLAKREPDAYSLNPPERWWAYVETTLGILDTAREPPSIERFRTVCGLLKNGFIIASKSPVDECLDVQSWVEFGFRILCASPKATDWSITDRDDSAITHEDKERMLDGLFPLLRAMLNWANKVPMPEDPHGGSLDALSCAVIRHLKIRDSGYWESMVRRKLFSTDSVTGLSQYEAAFFRNFIPAPFRLDPSAEVTPPAPMTEEKLTVCLLCDLANSRLRREQHEFYFKKDGALAAAIRREREKWHVESFDFDGLTAAVTDALSDNPSGKGLTIRMCEDLQTIVTHDWMASVASDNACSVSKKTIFNPDEFRKYGELIDALKSGFENRARKAVTKDAAEDWRNAADLLSSSLRRESLRDKRAWDFVLALITNHRAKPVAPVQVDFLTKGTPACRKFHRDLDGLIARISEHLPTYPSCAKEYLDYLVALRDGTLPAAELTAVAGLESRGIVVTEKDADDAMERLETNVRLYLQRLNFSRVSFEVAGQKGGKDLLGRYRFIQPQGLANGLCMFDPEVSSEVIVRNACPLCTFGAFEHDYDVLQVLQGIEEEWDRFFETVIVAVPGKPAFIAARNAYDELRRQLELQFGVVGYAYKTKEERQRLYETFREKLDDLAMTVFECDSQRPNLAPDPAASVSETAAQSAPVDAAPRRVTPPGAEEPSVTPGAYAASFAALDPVTRTLTITTSIRTKKKFTVPTDYFAAWKIVRGLVETTDPEGWLVFDGDFRNMKGEKGAWQGHFRHTSKPNAQMIELLRYIEGKPRGKRGTTCIRLLKHPRTIKKRKARTHKRTSV